MKKLDLLSIALLGLCLGSRSEAQRRLAHLNFAMPTSTDPNRLHFRSEGVPYLQDDLGNPIIGDTFLNSGLELHGDLLPQDSATPHPVLEVDLVTNYAGQLNLQTSSPTSFIPWLADGPVTTGGLQRFRFLWQTGSAPMDDRLFFPNSNFPFFGLLNGTSDDPTFGTALFALVGYSNENPPGQGPLYQGNPFISTPEPATLALFGSLLGAGGLLLRRKRWGK